jgi:hypothetical protein
MRNLSSLLASADDHIERAFLRFDWATFVKIWIAASIAITIFTFLLIFVPGIIIFEGMRAYYSIKGDSGMIGGVSVGAHILSLYVSMGVFTFWFAAFSGLIAVVSCPIFLVFKHLAGDLTARHGDGK